MIRPVDMLRIALGAIMVPTALAYFLPDLLPWVRTAQWQGAMATRLMGQLDASGLLAVAKFIQLTGGIALLLNRAVPFALAAMVAVNVCGAFVAVLIDGGVLLSLLALAVLALNVVLMLAYLPAYRGVLALRALADGESPQPGENYGPAPDRRGVVLLAGRAGSQQRYRAGRAGAACARSAGEFRRRARPLRERGHARARPLRHHFNFSGSSTWMRLG